MTSQPDLETLYVEATQALKSKDYDRASELLRQILKADVDYKDAAQLLARVIKLSRRRWYSDPHLWGAFGVLLLVGLSFFFFPRIQGLYDSQVPTASMVNPTGTSLPTAQPPTATSTATLLPTPTPIPLAWQRISLGQEFERDTVTAFATDKNDPDVIYAAMKNAGIYKTIDGGLSWRPAHQGLLNTQVESLLIDSQNSRILYAGTMGGIFKTEDGGENWFRIGDGTYLLMDMQDNFHVYARDENGIYETQDRGNTWTKVYPLQKDCPDEILSWGIHPANGKMLFIGGGETCPGVFQSSDNGHNWTLIGMEDKPNIYTLAIGLDEQRNISIYTYSVPNTVWAESGIYVSYDEGASWSFTDMGCDFLTSDWGNPATIYCAGGRLQIMQGKGHVWQDIPGTQSKNYTAVHIDTPNGIRRIITGIIDIADNNPNVGIFISTDDGASWTERSGGIGLTWAELKMDPMDNARMFLSTYYRSYNGCTLHRSLDSGKNWSSIKAKVDWCGPTFDLGDAFYLIQTGALQMSFNDGKDWLWGDKRGYASVDEWDDHLLPNYYNGGSLSISANPYARGLVYDIGNTIYYSTGSGWQPSDGSEGLSDARLFYTDPSKIIYAIGRYHQAFSTNNGVTWQSCGEDAFASRSDSRLALDSQGLRLYLATPGQGVMVSTDNCGSWEPSNKGLDNLFVNTLAVDPNNSEIVYAGTDGGAYVSFDSGQSWGQVNDGLLGATVVYSIAVDKDSNVYAATPYGIFKLEGK
jgi:photosystem II stability/assembly factor-like uncharacterized protein